MRLIVVALAIAAVAAVGCGDDGDAAIEPDGEALTAAFEERALDAYQAKSLDREEDFAQGVLTDECFAADAEAIGAVGEELGLSDPAAGEANFLSGAPGEEERLSCGIQASDEAAGAGLIAGTTPAEPDQLRERFLRDKDAEEIEGEPQGLDPDQVVATSGSGSDRFAWTDGSFVIGVFAAASEIEPVEGFAALEAAVEGVERTLTTEEE